MVEKYVVSIELAKRMKKLGWKQGKSYFIWASQLLLNWHLLDKTQFLEIFSYKDYEFIDAPLFAEIWEELPDKIENKNIPAFLQIIKNAFGRIDIEYRTREWEGDNLTKNVIKETVNDNPAKAAGELWCWGVENGYWGNK